MHRTPEVNVSTLTIRIPVYCQRRETRTGTGKPLVHRGRFVQEIRCVDPKSQDRAGIQSGDPGGPLGSKRKYTADELFPSKNGILDGNRGVVGDSSIFNLVRPELISAKHSKTEGKRRESHLVFPCFRPERKRVYAPRCPPAYRYPSVLTRLGWNPTSSSEGGQL